MSTADAHVHAADRSQIDEVGMRFKTWLRGPSDDGAAQVEVIGENGWYERSGHGQREQRSIMAELLTEWEVRHLEVSEGRWLLPGPPP